MARDFAWLRLNWCSSPSMTRFSRPVSSGSTVASWAARPMRRRTSVPWVRTSKPATVAWPSSAAVRVVRIRTAVVLPAPFGPRTAVTVPVGTSRSMPSRAVVSPYRFTSPVASTALLESMLILLDRRCPPRSVLASESAPPRSVFLEVNLKSSGFRGRNDEASMRTETGHPLAGLSKTLRRVAHVHETPPAGETHLPAWFSSGATASSASESRMRAPRARSKSSMPRCSASLPARAAWPGSIFRTAS